MNPVQPRAPLPARASKYTIPKSEEDKLYSKLNIIYGDTSTGKSTQLKRIAERIIKKKPFGPNRTKILLILSDGGSTSAYDHLIDAGIMEVLDIRTYIDPAKKFGPEVIIAGICSGKWLPFRYATDPQGNVVGTPVLSDYDWTQVAAVFVESLTTLSEMHLNFYTAAGIKLMDDSYGSYNMPSAIEGQTDYTYIKAGRSHYQASQDIALDWLRQLCKLPVPEIWITAHETKGGDDYNSQPVYGPALTGKAGTPRVLKNCAIAIHTDTVEKIDKDTVTGNSKLSVEYRGYFKRHPDVVNPKIMWSANARVLEEVIPELDAKWPGGYIPLVPGQTGIDTFLDIRQAAIDKKRKELETKFAEESSKEATAQPETK